MTATFIPSPFTSHTPLYTLLDLLSDADSEERKDLDTSQSADDPVPVEVSAESISENDPSSSPLATSADYAMTQTLGRTGVAIYRGDDGISVQFTSVERSRTNQRQECTLDSTSIPSHVRDGRFRPWVGITCCPSRDIVAQPCTASQMSIVPTPGCLCPSR